MSFKKTYLFLLSIIYFFLPAISQTVFYQEVCHCGVTGNGSSVSSSSCVLHFKVKIPPGSIIQKAYLISARDIHPDDITVTLNGIPYTFSDNTIATNGFLAFNQFNVIRPNSSIHLLDITNHINPLTSNYTLQVPQQNNLIAFYALFYMYIVFKKSSLPLTCINLFLNNQNVSPLTHYHLDSLNPINNISPVGLEVMTTAFCDTSQTYPDGSYVKVNNYPIGLLGGRDSISPPVYCMSSEANFAYYNDSLFGLADDTSDSLMSGADATADIKSYVNDNDTSVNLNFIYQSNLGPYTNPIRAVALNYVTGCDTFHTSISADTAICPGESSVQLHASGGISYQWQPAYGLSCTTCASPIASPDSSVTYTVRIFNNDSCSKVLPVHVAVPKESPVQNILVTPSNCALQNGKVEINAVNINKYILNNDTNTTGTFTNLGFGAYQATIIDNWGCVWQDSVYVGVQTNVVASFSVHPDSGQVPLNIHTVNLSQNANTYTWAVNGDTLHTSTITYTFDSAGHYTLTLIACHNSYPCCDTAQREIIVTQKNIVFVPNVFTPNQDGKNDAFIIHLKGVESGKIAIFNRWGTAIKKTFMQNADENHQLTLKWNGRTTAGKSCSAGTYYYVIQYIPLGKSIQTVKGYVTLLR